MIIQFATIITGEQTANKETNKQEKTRFLAFLCCCWLWLYDCGGCCCCCWCCCWWWLWRLRVEFHVVPSRTFQARRNINLHKFLVYIYIYMHNIKRRITKRRTKNKNRTRKLFLLPNRFLLNSNTPVAFCTKHARKPPDKQAAEITRKIYKYAQKQTDRQTS